MISTTAVPVGFAPEAASATHEHSDPSPVAAAPVKRAERISSIDVLRGFALLGILVLNIDSFGDVHAMYHDIPSGTSLDAFSGPHAHWSLALFYIKWLFFEGKMRGIFSMLFGAGVVLLTSRAEKRGAGGAIADIYLRRNMLLVLFGLIHACLIWGGDILFDYGLVALLFLYPFRKANPKKLLLAGTVMSLLSTFAINVVLHSEHDFSLSREAAVIATKVQQHQPLSASERAEQVAWQARVDTFAKRAAPAQVQQKVAEARQQGYWDGVLDRMQGYFGPGVSNHVVLMGDELAPMLMGMGLFQLGFLTAEVSLATYLWTALIGFGISLPLLAMGVARTYGNGHFFFLTAEEWLFLPYYLTREAGMFAIVSVVMILIKLGAFKRMQRLLAAVGKTALSNYLLTSLLCQFIFIWGPWKLFGTLQYYQLMYVVFGVWALNLAVSPLWLRYFQFGPVEWVWRSLTYGKRQPMLVRGEVR